MSELPSLSNEAAIKEWLKPVEDPELYLPIVDLGLIYTCTLDTGTGSAEVNMTLTSPGCPAGQYLVDSVSKRMKEHPSVKDVKVNIVWEPKWDPKTMASEECKETLGIW